MKEENKKKYEKPAMRVYFLPEPARLLQASRDDYDPTMWP